MKPYYLLAFSLLLFAACKSNSSSIQDTDKIYQLHEASCNTQLLTLDTLFSNSGEQVRLKISGECQEQPTFYDTIPAEEGNDTTQVYGWRDSKWHIILASKKGVKELFVEKSMFKDVLEETLLKGGLLEMPHKVVFNKVTQSIEFESFVGLPISDAGRDVEFEIDLNGKFKIASNSGQKIEEED